MQPTYLPWIGYFDLIDQVDKFVFLDDVQIEKSSWQVRNRIKTTQGELYLTIPRKKNKGGALSLIKDTEINNQQNWRKNHLKNFHQWYQKSHFYNEVMEFMEPLLLNDITHLGEFNINIIQKISQRIGIKTLFFRSSIDLRNTGGGRDVRLANICRHLTCNEYLSPQGSAVYIEMESAGGELTKSGISLYYHNYTHPNYLQQGDGFTPYMGIVDLLFNVGFENTLTVIKSGRQPLIDCFTFRKELENK